MAEVQLQGITKTFGTAAAVDNVDLTIRDGEFFSLLGPSGCGKSTLLSIIAGLLPHDFGKIYIDGVESSAKSPKERGIAMVFQDYALYPHMSVFDNLAFPLKAEKWSKAQILEKVTEAAEPLELGELLQRHPRDLSGGQRQRVALGRALVRDPKVFLMDEPLSNLDARLRIQMRRELRLLQERLAATVIYVTHDQAEAMTLSDQMAVMSAGRVQHSGAPLSLYDRPANRFVARFLGDIGMNLVSGTLSREGGRAYWTSGPLRWQLSEAQQAEVQPLIDGHPLDLGVHAENVLPAARGDEQWASGELVLREHLGDEQHLHIDLAGHTVVMRFSPHSHVEHAQTMAVALKKDSVHIFDTETGLRLGEPGESGTDAMRGSFAESAATS